MYIRVDLKDDISEQDARWLANLTIAALKDDAIEEVIRDAVIGVSLQEVLKETGR